MNEALPCTASNMGVAFPTITAFLVTACISFVGLRVYVGLFLVRSFGYDDLAASLSLVSDHNAP